MRKNSKAHITEKLTAQKDKKGQKWALSVVKLFLRNQLGDLFLFFCLNLNVI